jgi:hypothetical protein
MFADSFSARPPRRRRLIASAPTLPAQQSVRQHRCPLPLEVGAVARDDGGVEAACHGRDERVAEAELAARLVSREADGASG